jgi:hypothetical protein
MIEPTFEEKRQMLTLANALTGLMLAGDTAIDVQSRIELAVTLAASMMDELSAVGRDILKQVVDALITALTEYANRRGLSGFPRSDAIDARAPWTATPRSEGLEEDR